MNSVKTFDSLADAMQKRKERMKQLAQKYGFSILSYKPVKKSVKKKEE